MIIPENSRETVSVSTICDEYCRINLHIYRLTFCNPTVQSDIFFSSVPNLVQVIVEFLMGIKRLNI